VNAAPALVAIGCSAGGLQALQVLLPILKPGGSAALVLVSHTGSASVAVLCELLAGYSSMPVVEAVERGWPMPAQLHVAPSGYHLLMEKDGRFALSVDPRVMYSRPSIDVLFESAALAYGPRLCGVVLSGANHDGAAGLAAIRSAGGLAVVQDPATAEADAMPRAAIARAGVDHVLPPPQIGALLNTLRGL